MLNNFLIQMKSELLLTLIIFILLFLKIGKKERNNGTLLHAVNFLLFVNFVAGFFFNSEGSLFNDMFKTNHLIALEKNILNLGTLIILICHSKFFECLLDQSGKSRVSSLVKLTLK